MATKTKKKRSKESKIERRYWGFMPDKESLAWAAGFFDGEGSFYCSSKKYPRASVGQADPGPLRKFCHIVKLGKVAGPFAPRKGQIYFTWKYRTTNWPDTQMLMILLWDHLSRAKKVQAIRSMRTYRKGNKWLKVK